MTPIEAVETYINGNKGDFSEWLKTCSKLEMLAAFEHFRGGYGYPPHQIIAIFRSYLKD